MKVFLFRHAERLGSFEADPPLSPRGEGQAKRLISLCENRLLPKPQILLASPKMRAQQTLQPLSLALNLELRPWELLDELQRGERINDLANRVEHFNEALVGKVKSYFDSGQEPGPFWQSTVFCVTHSDWLECFLASLDCEPGLPLAAHYLSVGEYLQFSFVFKHKVNAISAASIASLEKIEFVSKGAL